MPIRARDWPIRAALTGLRVTLACVALSAAASAAVKPVGAPEDECDRLAQPPRPAMGKLTVFSDGVALSAMHGAEALAACMRSMTEQPGEIRFVAYAARASDKTGDTREAVRLYRLAAGQGNALAQNNLGVLYEAGQGGLARNDRDAEHFYRLAAEQDFPGGQANLGVLYATGRGGLPRNDREAVRLWQLAAEQDDAQAQNNLGRMYAEGRGGLPRDTHEAARMWRLAADQGSTEARGNLRKLGVGN